jgi:hypothetical protein
VLIVDPLVVAFEIEEDYRRVSVLAVRFFQPLSRQRDAPGLAIGIPRKSASFTRRQR